MSTLLSIIIIAGNMLSMAFGAILTWSVCKKTTLITSKLIESAKDGIPLDLNDYDELEQDTTE